MYTVLYFSVRSPGSHANFDTGAIFIHIASTPYGERTTIHRGGGYRGGLHHSPQRLHTRHPPPQSVDFRPLPRLRSQYKQRWRVIACDLTEKLKKVNSLFVFRLHMFRPECEHSTWSLELFAGAIASPFACDTSTTDHCFINAISEAPVGFRD